MLRPITTPADLHRSGLDHLWPHHSALATTYAERRAVMVSGEGCCLIDLDGHRVLDGLSGRFAVQIGYSFGPEMGEVAARQLATLPYASNRGGAHLAALELAGELAALAPDGLGHVFFTTGGSEAVEAAWKLARQHHALGGERRWKAIARDGACHGVTMGALSLSGVGALRVPFEPLVPQVAHVRSTDRFRRPDDETEEQFCAYLLDDLERTIWAQGPETIALVVLEPVQRAGGALTAPEGYFAGVRALCDEHGILLCADEVVTGFGRVGDWFASDRLGVRPDLIACAKGLSSGYAAIGALIVSDEVADTFRDSGSAFAHGTTSGGHPVQAALALKNIEIMRREALNDRVLAHERDLGEVLGRLRDLPIVGDVRGTGFLYALELVKDHATDEAFSGAEREWLMRSFLPRRLYDAGLLCDADDRGAPVIQVAPPLVAGRRELGEIGRILRAALSEAAERVA